jgi:hypothetical protein
VALPASKTSGNAALSLAARSPHETIIAALSKSAQDFSTAFLGASFRFSIIRMAIPLHRNSRGNSWGNARGARSQNRKWQKMFSSSVFFFAEHIYRLNYRTHPQTKQRCFVAG